MSQPTYLGTTQPQLILYLPHRPNNLEQLTSAPSAQNVITSNSNHWRKIVTLLAKVASPDAEGWRSFRDEVLFQHTALCFAADLVDSNAWHWIGGKENLKRFASLRLNAAPLKDCPEVCVDIAQRILLTPYPDYRQLSNAVVGHIRTMLVEQQFYE